MPLGQPPTKIEEYWDWVAVALFLLISMDLLLSIYAGATVGLEHEGNPFMKWLLTQPLLLIIGVHIAALILAILGFWLLFELVQRTEGLPGKVLRFITELYLGLLVAIGLFVFANNISVIILGDSLI